MTSVQQVNAAVEQPSISIVLDDSIVMDDGFVNVKFEDLNEKVQAAVRTLIEQYDINLLQYNAEKKITKVTATSKDDQSEKIVYFDDEGKEVTLDAAPQSTTEAPKL
jgi:hypothetical protein